MNWRPIKAKWVVLAAVSALALCGVAGLYTLRPQLVPESQQTSSELVAGKPPGDLTKQSPRSLPPTLHPAELSTPAPLISPTRTEHDTPSVVTPPEPPAPAVNGGKPPPQDPAARIALSLVGIDPEAELYWYAAINDPNLPAGERQDLIEDLNEDGFPDPDHPTFEDLPLIVSRLEILSEMAPYTMDKVNADATTEAEKDLLNMYESVVSGR